MDALPHILTAQAFSKEFLESVFARTDEMVARGGKHYRSDALCGKKVFLLFLEPSTRTRESFAAAALALGASVRSLDNPKETMSLKKGETLSETVYTLSRYYDAIVLRQSEAYVAREAALASSVPVINAGDGPNEHPTQAILDLYTVREWHKKIDGLTVLIAGDLMYGRTVHSLVYALSLYKIKKLIFVPHPLLPLPRQVQKYAELHGIPCEETDCFWRAVPEADVIYQTRVQKERLKDEAVAADSAPKIDEHILAVTKKDACILHPLPHGGELARTALEDPRTLCFSAQEDNGLFTRMALLEMIFEQTN
ncbi:MAG: aspartate carbamoyltransferase [Parcubacteria group bacterium]|nr:aspartate carbamoyltransferase [Parcubacteria group bacterium]